jgi:tRNA(adenine34) deaminase
MKSPSATVDEKFMRMAIAEAVAAAREGNAPIGSVITRNGRVVERGHNQVFTKHDVTAHAETVCIRKLTKRLGNFNLRGYTLYSTFEPCAICMVAMLRTNISRVVYGAQGEDAPQFSSGILQQANRRVHELAKRRLKFTPGILQEECAELLAKAKPD